MGLASCLARAKARDSSEGGARSSQTVLKSLRSARSSQTVLKSLRSVFTERKDTERKDFSTV